MSDSQRNALIEMMRAILACSCCDKAMRFRATVLLSMLTGDTGLFADLIFDPVRRAAA